MPNQSEITVYFAAAGYERDADIERGCFYDESFLSREEAEEWLKTEHKDASHTCISQAVLMPKAAVKA